jgi:uncharacterized protein YkwD
MKNLIATLILTIVTLVGFSQSQKEVITLSSVEKETFKKINEYRVKNGRKAIVWCEKAYDAAYHHSYYLSDVNIELSHYETQDVPNVNEINSPGDRIAIILNSPSAYCVENTVTISASDWWFNRKGVNTVSTMADAILESWVESKGHNENMLDRTVDYGAIAIVREKNGDYCRPVLLLYKK